MNSYWHYEELILPVLKGVVTKRMFYSWGGIKTATSTGVINARHKYLGKNFNNYFHFIQVVF